MRCLRNSVCKVINLVLIAFLVSVVNGQQSIALVNGNWFDGKRFKKKQNIYSVDGAFTYKEPKKVDRTIDLSGLWVVPPFADAHNHSFGSGRPERDRAAATRFIDEGVFYIKIHGNLPISREELLTVGVNTPTGVDALLAQGNITGPGGHPIGLIENVLLPEGFYRGHTKESLRDYRYFAVADEADLEKKWPLILKADPDFLKIILWYSEEYETRKNDPAYFSRRGLDPALLPLIVKKAHAAGLKVAAHVTSTADFRNAIDAGVDELSHLPLLGRELISENEAHLAADRGVMINTTAERAYGIVRLPRVGVPVSEHEAVTGIYTKNLRLLHASGARLVIGSDDVNDTSVNEVLYLDRLGIFDAVTLLNMWTETTARSIFPNRKIGRLVDGYEASFIALEADPLTSLANVKRIRYRFKQGVLLEPTPAGN